MAALVGAQVRVEGDEGSCKAPNEANHCRFTVSGSPTGNLVAQKGGAHVKGRGRSYATDTQRL